MRGVRSLPIVAGILLAAATGWAADAESAGGVAPIEVAAGGDESPTRTPIDIMYLANEGFLVTVDGHGVLVDPFLSQPIGEWAVVPEPMVDAMIAAEPPFDRVDLVLVSHMHADHYQMDFAQKFFAARPDVPIAASPTALDVTFGADRSPRPGIVPIAPEDGAPGKLMVGDITVEYFPLPHSGEAWADVEHYAFLLEIDGRTIAHLADTDLGSPALAALDLASRDLDVAIIPFWWVPTRGGRSMIEKFIGADLYVVCHIPAGKEAQVEKRVSLRLPGAFVPQKAGESLRF
ncbi:MAG: MBL fold metallo-hydrolase [Gemmatimonadetes bacterium]|nr:MBL fold metallo-hydrolase [Gemmatimonadota bacterium]